MKRDYLLTVAVTACITRLFVKSPVILFTIALLLVIPLNIICEPVQEITVQDIKRPGGDYFWGEGRSPDRDEARERALRELATNVATQVSSSFESIIKESNLNSEDFLQSVVNVNSSGYFRELQPIFNRDGRDWVALYFIHRDYLQGVYQERKQAIINMFETANSAREAANVSTALQFYYHCIVLMNSIPDASIDYQGKDLRREIPILISSVLDDIKIDFESDKMERDDMRTVVLNVSYKDKPVQCLHFVYLEGGQVNTSRARNGRAVCELYRASVSYTSLDVEIEYRFANLRELSPMVNQLWSVVHRPSFNNNKIKVNLQQTISQPPPPPEIKPAVSNGFEIFLKNEVDCPVEQEIKKELFTFLGTLKRGQESLNSYAQDTFLKEKLESMFKFNNPSLVDSKFHIEINKTWDGWEVRSIPVSCRYPSIATRTMEYLVLDFDEQGKLRDVNFNVFDELYQSYVKGERYSEEEKAQRQVILKFLEKYRTAFLNRDIETLEKIFADEAVIIVGRVLQTAKTERHYELERSTEQVEYQKYTKKEYLERQRKMFDRRKDIHLGFNSFNILKRDAQTDIYGVSMRQQFASSEYSDEGYLFLLIDFVEKDPKIYIRSWQPQEWSNDQIIRMNDFHILK